jgi:hypothetical protein
MATRRSFLKTIPRKSLLAFLGGVFLIFSTVGLASDIAEMGRMPALRFALSVFLSGLFPVFYAVTGFALRKQFWKAMVPILVLHFLLMNAIVRWLPAGAQAAHMDAAEIARLQSRLTLDGLTIMFAVGLGYGCFLYVTVTEGRRYLRVQAEMELAAEIHHVIVPPIEANGEERGTHAAELRRRQQASSATAERSAASAEEAGHVRDILFYCQEWRWITGRACRTPADSAFFGQNG